MDYEKLHKDTINRLQQMVNSGKITVETARGICADFLPESEDEKIVKELLAFFRECVHGGHILTNKEYDSWIAWLEKQGEHANFRNKIQVGDKVTRNEDGVLVNLSQLKRVAKKDEKQGEQKSAWSEEDEVKINRIVACLENLNVADNDILLKDVNWFKSLKDRVQHQNTWKPSDEQMKALKDALNDAIWQYDFKGSLIKEEVTRKHAETIESLYNDLKKLKGE